MNNLHSNNPVSDNDNGWRAFFRAVWRWFRNLFSRSATEAPTPTPASAPVRTQAPVAWSQTESNKYLEEMIGLLIKTRIAEAKGVQLARSENDLYKEVTANQNKGRISWGADELNDAVNAALSKRRVVKPAPKKTR
ncbi:hypothetical protein F3J29_05960 [Enterobacter sp. Cy-643]|uniref:hypothetical protein n=1 Tax=Enterobacter sp. Cy-643 TaxID=2608346 RepID=UPI00141E309B|nr:hypothetical protein [Enterobacter sp. Cy-643]NIF31679.1 hypothetical protein [Enterobacter sp. Cy-643]